MSVPAIPAGYHSINVYLVVADADASIDFIQRALGAELREKVVDSQGRALHAALRIGDGIIMLGRADPGQALSSTTLYIYTEDCDSLFNQAITAGGRLIRPLADQPYGDRNGGFVDPDGNLWYIGTHKEHISDEEIARRYDELAAKRGEAQQ